MTKEEYKKLLLDPRWDVVRKNILKRDKYICQGCKRLGMRLSVHHKVYFEGKKPWQYAAKHLVSLCDECHSKAHEGRTIQSFIAKPTKPKVVMSSKKRPRGKRQVWKAGVGLQRIEKGNWNNL